MAPEQMRAADAASAASDQYGAAASLYQALTARLPHEAPTAADLVVKKATEPPADVRRHRPELAPALAAALMRALAGRPADRHPHVATFRRALEAATAAPGRR
jgi:serine/threonine-protein kinase